MNIVRQGWLVLAAIMVVFAIAVGVAISMGTHAAKTLVAQPVATEPVVDDGRQLVGAKGHLFDRKSVYTFLAAAKQAEALADPMQRCTTYPDPPGSHWSPAAVHAYCRYRTYPVMSYEEVRELLQRGEFAELDQRLGAMLQDKLTKPDLYGVMDRAYDTWFNRGDLELRPLLENWKRARPQSAYAYAASGISLVAMSAQARGSEYASKTLASQFEAMNRLILLADADLRRAVELDARMTPAYAAMIDASRYGLGHAYLPNAAKTGLRADPANFAIYNSMMFALQPKWGGSLEAMTRVSKMAKQHAAENPLLLLLPEKAMATEADLDSDDCKVPGRFELFSVIFDQVAVAQQLLTAGFDAEPCNHLELSVVYFSEALRFYPEGNDVRLDRAFNLNEFDESAWAAQEAASLMAQDPRDARYVVARAYARESLNDYPGAEKDFLAALAMKPDEGTTYGRLIGLYLNDMHDWDKAWKLDERIIELFPSSPYGWVVRAHIQQSQPRPGLKDTADYFQAHFDTSPEMHKELVKMRAGQALEEGRAKSAGRAAGK
jgi:tetratricopeptide (TPR) repeat protein